MRTLLALSFLTLTGCSHESNFRIGEPVLISRAIIGARSLDCLGNIQALATPQGTDPRRRSSEVAAACALKIEADSQATIVNWGDDFSEVQLKSGDLSGQRAVIRSEFLTRARPVAYNQPQ
jgi:hypothetical protein